MKLGIVSTRSIVRNSKFRHLSRRAFVWKRTDVHRFHVTRLKDFLAAGARALPLGYARLEHHVDRGGVFAKKRVRSTPFRFHEKCCGGAESGLG